MPKPRTPLAKARLEGRDKKDPQRFRGRNEPAFGLPLGRPPEWLVDTEQNKARSAWLLFEKEIPWLTEQDRMLVQMAASIQGRFMAGKEVGVQSMGLLRQMLAQMGATPADRTKVAIPDAGETKDDILDD